MNSNLEPQISNSNSFVHFFMAYFTNFGRGEIKKLTTTATPVSLNLGIQISLTICPSAPAIKAYFVNCFLQNETEIKIKRVAK